MSWRSADLSLIQYLWFVLALSFLVAFCTNKISTHLAIEYRKSRFFTLLEDLIRYGKTKNLHRSDWLRVFDVPKRWFWHFYGVSVCWNTILLVLHLKSAYQQQPYPSWLSGILDVLTGVSSTDIKVPQLSTVLVQLLLCVHSVRRLLECLFVSVFSDGVIHLVQYVFGLGYYIMLGLTVLSLDRSAKSTGSLPSQLGWIHITGFIVFIGASLLQHQSMVLLARLRTGKSGRVETLAHRVPKGGWFELVSCPHYFAELLIYVSFSLAHGGLCLTLWLVVLYVFFNQALAAHLCHDFYIRKYDSYPKHRRAFLPFVL